MIEPSLIQLNMFLNPVIEYGTGQITLDDMLSENILLLQKLLQKEYCPTVEITVKEYLFLAT
ncbi:hypothetical protein [Bacillus sp. RC51]|uniref:hypothetical protein n=1 Tax=Bacillus TaxID=1386 RepID=UPI003834539A